MMCDQWICVQTDPGGSPFALGKILLRGPNRHSSSLYVCGQKKLAANQLRRPFVRSGTVVWIHHDTSLVLLAELSRPNLSMTLHRGYNLRWFIFWHRETHFFRSRQGRVRASVVLR